MGSKHCLLLTHLRHLYMLPEGQILLHLNKKNPPEWGSAAGAHETYGTEMQSYLLGAQDLSTTLQTVDEVVSELLSK